jgi:hypothetical protein
MTVSTLTNPQPSSQVYVPIPNVQLNGAALTSAKIKYVYGHTAFIELGLNVARNEQGEAKYRLEDGRLIAMRAVDYTFLGFNILGFVRKLYGCSNEDLNFLDIEIPKFIRWYLWEEETQEQARKLFENISLKGLAFLRDVSYKGNAIVQDRIFYWMKLIEIAIAPPISKENFTEGLNNFLASHSALNDRIFETAASLNEADTTFGKKIRELVKNEDLKRINTIFEQAYSKKEEQNPQIVNEIDNSYTKYINVVRAATRQTISIAEMHHLRKESHQISHSAAINIPVIEEYEDSNNEFSHSANSLEDSTQEENATDDKSSNIVSNNSATTSPRNTPSKTVKGPRKINKNHPKQKSMDEKKSTTTPSSTTEVKKDT